MQQQPVRLLILALAVAMAPLVRQLPWWAVLGYTRPFADGGEYQFSNLDKTMSDVSVFRRVDRASDLPAQVERLGDERHQWRHPLALVDVAIEEAR